MQTVRDTLDEKQKNKRPKSSSRFPKQMPSYIVAFAVHETYDDIATAQQMICNKRSLQGSASSVSPALSSKTITIDRNSTQKIVDNDFSEAKNETKINIDEGNVENDKNYDVQRELADIKDFLVVDDKREDDANESKSKVNLVESNKTFDVVKSTDKVNSNETENNDDFESIKKPKSYVNKLSKKKRKNQYRIRNVDFKYKKSIKKAEKVCKRSAKLKETFYSNSVSKVVSRTSLLKSVPAKVNIIDATDSILMSDDGSLQSSPSTTKKSFISYSSQDTLRQPGSTSSSRNEGMDSINSVSSVLKMPSDKIIPYKTEVINVAVAVAYNPNKNVDVVTKTSEPYRPMYNEDLMSTETLVQPPQMLTSESTSSENSDKNDSGRTFESKEMSENTYVVGNSSDFDDSSGRSEDTLAPNSETFMFSENLRPTFPIYNQTDIDKSMNRTALLDTVINMGIFPEMTPSTSSEVNFNHNFNNVFITGDSGKFMENPPFKRDITLEKIKETSKYVLKKSNNQTENELSTQKNINLPDESAIKAFINDNDKMESKFCSGEIGNYPSSMTELWDRLVMVVDTAVKRLENSLTEKIISEMKRSLTMFEHTNQTTKQEVLACDVDKEKGDMVISNNEVSIEKEDERTEVDEILQCDLVGNQIIDNIMLKLSLEGPRAIIPGTSSKSLQKCKRPKIFRDRFEVLKPPVVECTDVEGKGDTITVSTTAPSELEDVKTFKCTHCILRSPMMFFRTPMTFLRENMLVISSVPAFFIIMLCVYGLIVLVVKPW